MITNHNQSPTTLCVECFQPLDSATAIKLTARSAMCPRCYQEALDAWLEDFGHCQDQARCPDPAELRARIEAECDSVGKQVRHDRASSLPGNLLYMPKKIAYRSARRTNKMVGDV